MKRPAVGAIKSPNIWEHPDVYELENLASDPDGVIEAAMRDLNDWAGLDVLDVGCGTGFHLPGFAASARSVVGVDPHPGLASLGRHRCRRSPNVSVLDGTAQQLPLASASVDVAHARWAYFFGPGCEPGLRELDRVVRRGGIAFVIDNDATRSTFGGWFRRGCPEADPVAVGQFWSGRGWTCEPLDIEWRFESQRDLEAVVRIEFDPATADALLAEHEATIVDYAINLWWRNY